MYPQNNEVVMAGDGQATLGETVIFKSKSVKVRRIGNGKSSPDLPARLPTALR